MTRMMLAALLVIALSGVALAQDTTPPVLLEFSISPVAFDTGPSSVTG